jgi:hypothetical protein
MVYIHVGRYRKIPFKLYTIALGSCCKGGGWNNSAWNTRSKYIKEQGNGHSSNRGFRLMLITKENENNNP